MTSPRSTDEVGTSMADRLSRRSFHYGWVVAVLGMATTFASLGIARFSLGMLLPSMREDLALTYTDMGIISTGNFVGYLVAALICGRLVAAFGARRVIVAGLATITVSLLVVAASRNVATIWPAYVVTGLGSGSAYVAASGLVPHWFSRRWRGRAAGLLVIGSGPAMVLSGFLVPAVIAEWGAPGWRVGWLILGLVVAVVALVVGLLVRNHPSDLGLDAHIHSEDRRPTGHGPTIPPTSPAVAPVGGRTLRIMLHLGTLYFLFGATYVVYVTFIVTSLVQDHGISQRDAGYFWVIVGAMSMFSGPVFGALSDRAGRGVGLAVVFSLQAMSYLIISRDLPSWTVYASVLFFGVCAFSIPGIMVAAIADYLPPTEAASAFGTLTMAFGIGQAVGPVIAGALAERSGTFASAFLLAAIVAACGAALSLTLRPAQPAVRPGA